MSKALSFLYGGLTGLYITKPGFDLNTPNLPREAFLFDSRWSNSVRVISKTVQSVASLPSTTIDSYGTVRRVFLSTGFARVPLAIIGAYSTNLEQGLPGIRNVPPIVRGNEVFVKQTELNFGSAVAVVTTLLDFPANSSTPGGVAGTRRVRLANDGIYVAADPHEAVTASVDNHLIHPSMTAIAQPVGVFSGSALPNWNGQTGSLQRFWQDYSIGYSQPENRTYISNLAYGVVLFPNASTVRVINPFNVPHYVAAVR